MSERALQLQTPTDNARRLWLRPARSAAFVAAGFLLAVGLVMIDSYIRELKLNPLTVGPIQTLKANLVQQPDDEHARNQLREIDKQVRRSHFLRRSLALRGGYLMLGGIGLLLITLKSASKLVATPYLPDPNVSLRSMQARMATMARAGVLAFGLLGAGVLIGLATMPRFWLPDFVVAAVPDQPLTPQAAQLPLPPAQQFLRNWPIFRGPLGNGVVVTPAKYPTEWDGPSGNNILWKVKVDLPGNSSPLVWEDRVFLIGAVQDKREVYCLDAATGQLLWNRPVGPPGNRGLELGETSGGYAPSTPATDGRAVFAIFPTGDLAAFDFAGKQLWAKSLGLPDNGYGHAASLLIYRDRLIIQYDQGNVPKNSNSNLFAFDTMTGNPLWKTKRDMPASWSTPIIAHAKDADQIITCAVPFVVAYDPQNGKEIWRAKGMNGEMTPSPIFAGGMVFACNDRAALLAIRPDGSGDVTATHIAWEMSEYLPEIVSPLSDGQLVYMVDNGGKLTCVDAKDGQTVYKQEMDAEFKASPVLLGNVVYMLDLKGVMRILETGRAYKELGKAVVEEECQASPAFAGGRIYLRGVENLYCIGPK